MNNQQEEQEEPSGSFYTLIFLGFDKDPFAFMERGLNCCILEERNMNGWCIQCGAPCF
jgi:hypothetical protein